MIKLFYFFVLNHFSIISMNSDLNSEDMKKEYLNNEDELKEFYVYENVDPKNIKSILKQKKSDENNKKKHVTFNCYLEEIEIEASQNSNSKAFVVNSTALDEMKGDDDDYTNIVEDFLKDL